MKRLIAFFLSVFCIARLFPQSAEVQVYPTLRDYWQQHQLPLQDIDYFKVSDTYTDYISGLTYTYVQQLIGDIYIQNAIGNIISKNGKVVYTNLDRWIDHVADKLNSQNGIITGSEAATAALTLCNAVSYLRSKPILLAQYANQRAMYKKTESTLEDIPCQMVYLADESGSLHKYYKVDVHLKNGNYWSNYVDVQNGNVIKRENQTLACFPNHGQSTYYNEALLPFAGPQYKVLPIPINAPNEGTITLINDPHDNEASSLGWHDDGTTKFTITKGNNVHAFSDPDSNYISSKDEPDGGASLNFNYEYIPNGTVKQNTPAAITNLFYMNNVMHDFAYYYGFTEQAGNFQTKNSTGKGKANDAVIALGEFGANAPSNSEFRNNANFLPPVDGTPGRMRMYIWNVSNTRVLKIIDPVPLAKEFDSGFADFGGTISSSIPLTGKAVIVSDGSANPSLGCAALVNASDVKGKIALIDRGTCFFHEKACFAQAAGAIAVIIINYENATNNMTGISPAPCTINIPVISVGSNDGRFIRDNAGTITLSFLQPNVSNIDRDGCFDNGIVSHEYGHGISTRLTGGPSNSSCLLNDEQMGEGWSDFFALVLSTKPTDKDSTLRAIGTFPLQQAANGKGIRKYQYTTSMIVNPETYENTFTTQTEHDLGEVWAEMLWEMYWRFSDVYGWDPDIYKGKGGNNKAIRLVFEGLKIQPCSPGFVDGRDAILKADSILYDKADYCLIWSVFAKRGLGYSAVQGSTNNRSDGIEAYDLPPTCVPTVKIAKQMTPATINPGEDITVNITIRNDTKSNVNSVSVKDIIPDGASLKPNSATVTLSQNLNVISFNKNVLGAGEVFTLSYKLATDNNKYSVTKFIDSMENTEGSYDPYALKGTSIWGVTTKASHSGKSSWFIADKATANDQILNTIQSYSITGLKQPVLRFYQYYKTQYAFDGGVINISTDNGLSFQDLGKSAFRNGYSGPLSYLAIPVPNSRAFYGDNKTFVPTYIDLNNYKNQNFKLQFRFGSDDQTAGTGWYIDDLEIMDVYNYNSQACIIFNDNQSVCAEAPSKGTIVESRKVVATKTIPLSSLEFSVAPNPATDHVLVRTHFPTSHDISGEITTVDGKLIQKFRWRSQERDHPYWINTEGLNTGMYWIHITSGQYAGTRKITIIRP